MLWSVFFILFIFSSTLFGEDGSITGRVIDSRTKEGLIGVNVILVGTKRGAVTNEDGYFILDKVQQGKYSIEFRMMGYKNIVLSDVVVAGGRKTEVMVSMEETVISIHKEIKVTTGKFRIQEEGRVSERVLGTRQVWDTPGSAADLFQVVQTIPGVASSGDVAPIYVRGGSPDENLVLFDGATMSSAFYIEPAGGGVFGIFHPLLLKEVEVSTGGFGVEYGDRISSVLDVRTKDGNKEKLKGTLSTSMADAGLLLDGPIGSRTSFLFSGRRSYYDLVLKMMPHRYDYELTPNFFDFQGKITLEPTVNQKISITGLLGGDNIGLILDLPDYQGEWKWNGRKDMVSLGWQGLLGSKGFSRIVLSESAYKREIKQGPFWHYNQKDREFQFGGEGLVSIGNKHELNAGFSTKVDKYSLSQDMPDYEGTPENEARIIETNLSSYKVGFYFEERCKFLKHFIWNIGARQDYFSTTGEMKFSPRASIAYTFGGRSSVYWAVGIYRQFPKPDDVEPKYGNPNLNAKKAIHTILGWEQEYKDILTLRLEGYYKKISLLPLRNSFYNLTNDGYGKAYGGEVFLQKHRGKLSGWLSYAYSVASRREYDDIKEYPFDFDQRHIVSLVANYKPTQFYQIGARWRYSSGRPWTPLSYTYYDSSAGRYKPVWGEHKSSFFPSYHRLDMRLIHYFRLFGKETTGFVELMNVYNRLNVIEYEWTKDYRERKPFTIFSFLPVAGIMMEF